jgi:hypothetical protein
MRLLSLRLSLDRTKKRWAEREERFKKRRSKTSSGL